MSRPRKHPQHRSLSPEEMYAMGFADMASHDAEDGWPYPDDDDEETIEHFRSDEKWIDADCGPESAHKKRIWRDD